MKRVVVALVLAASSVGAVQAGTNLTALADYPAPSCGKTEKPNDVPEMKIGEDPVTYNKRIKQHNELVAQYNTALHDYAACMNTYVANAQADLDLIRDRVNKAVTAANATR